MKINHTAAVALSALVVITGSIANADDHNGKRSHAEQSHMDSEQSVTEFFAGKLMLMNHSTILMSNMAAEKTSSEDVKQFANMLHQSHAKLNRKLADSAPEIAAITTLDSAGKVRSSGYRGQPHEREDAAGQESPTANADEELQQKAFESPLHHVLSIQRQATENYLQTSTEMLSKYQGQDFDMGFLGFQIGQHTWALAELEAMQDVGDKRFQSLVSAARDHMKQHLQKARELSSKYEDSEE